MALENPDDRNNVVFLVWSFVVWQNNVVLVVFFSRYAGTVLIWHLGFFEVNKTTLFRSFGFCGGLP